MVFKLYVTGLVLCVGLLGGCFVDCAKLTEHLFEGKVQKHATFSLLDLKPEFTNRPQYIVVVEQGAEKTLQCKEGTIDIATANRVSTGVKSIDDLSQEIGTLCNNKTSCQVANTEQGRIRIRFQCLGEEQKKQDELKKQADASFDCSQATATATATAGKPAARSVNLKNNWCIRLCKNAVNRCRNQKDSLGCFHSQIPEGECNMNKVILVSRSR